MPKGNLKKHLLYRLTLSYFLTFTWLAIWRIFRRSPLSEEKYPNRNPCLEAPLYITEFQVATRKGSRTSLSDSGAIDILKRTGSITKLQKAMGHSSINVSLTYLRGLEVAELKEEDMHLLGLCSEYSVVFKKTPNFIVHDFFCLIITNIMSLTNCN